MTVRKYQGGEGHELARLRVGLWPDIAKGTGDQAPFYEALHWANKGEHRQDQEGRDLRSILLVLGDHGGQLGGFAYVCEQEIRRVNGRYYPTARLEEWYTHPGSHLFEFMFEIDKWMRKNGLKELIVDELVKNDRQGAYQQEFDEMNRFVRYRRLIKPVPSGSPAE